MLNKKKLTSLALAGVMTLSLAVPAFASSGDGGQDAGTTATTTATTQDDGSLSAAETASGNTSTTVSGNYVAIPIEVSVPKQGSIQINPYGLPVTIKAVASGGSDTTLTGWKIVSQPMYMTNEGTVDLKVSASVTTKVSGSKNSLAEMVSAAPTSTTTAKQIYAQLQMVANTASVTGFTGTSASDWAIGLADADKDALNALFGKTATWTGATSLTLSSEQAVSKADMVTLAAATPATKGSDDTVTASAKYNTGSIALFRISGSVTEDPETAWTTSDGFTATIAFTFKPSTTT
jgi:hypothetical protein